MLKIGAKSFRDGSQDICRVQRVIWDHLLAFRLKVSRSKLHFSFRAEQLAMNNNELELIMESALFSGSYALHTDSIVRGNLVCQSVSIFEEEMTRDRYNLTGRLGTSNYKLLFSSLFVGYCFQCVMVVVY